MKFSRKYFIDNNQEGETTTIDNNCVFKAKSPFKTEDQVSTLAYSILMLNSILEDILN